MWIFLETTETNQFNVPRAEFTRQSELKPTVSKKQTGKRSPVNFHKCLQCKNTYDTLTALVRHIPVHSVSNSFKCNQCLASFNSHIRLYAHVQRIHTSSQAYQCPVCSKIYKSKTSIDRHMMVSHSNSKAIISCEQC
jgi:uncharacterized Zn-finger protein